MPCVDLLPGFVAIGQQRGLFGAELFEDENHFSVLGHEAAAQLLVEPVREALASKAQE